MNDKITFLENNYKELLNFKNDIINEKLKTKINFFIYNRGLL